MRTNRITAEYDSVDRAIRLKLNPQTVAAAIMPAVERVATATDEAASFLENSREVKPSERPAVADEAEHALAEVVGGLTVELTHINALKLAADILAACDARVLPDIHQLALERAKLTITKIATDEMTVENRREFRKAVAS